MFFPPPPPGTYPVRFNSQGNPLGGGGGGQFMSQIQLSQLLIRFKRGVNNARRTIFGRAIIFLTQTTLGYLLRGKIIFVQNCSNCQFISNDESTMAVVPFLGDVPSFFFDILGRTDVEARVPPKNHSYQTIHHQSTNHHHSTYISVPHKNSILDGWGIGVAGDNIGDFKVLQTC